jgi:hypothetical protein
MQSKSGKMNKEDYKKWGMNFLKFVAPTLAIFFGQLAVGVNFEYALPLAIFAFYQSLSDFFSKLNAGK